jgi:hypothetical protein
VLNKGLFSSANNEWETPDDLFNALDEIFHFDLDVCATKDNTKCEQFFSPEDDGLKQSWGKYEAHWQAWEHSITVVALLPARTDTKWWHAFVMRAQQIWFIKGRIKFVGGESSAPFPSCIVIWMGTVPTRPPTIRSWSVNAKT